MAKKDIMTVAELRKALPNMSMPDKLSEEKREKLTEKAKTAKKAQTKRVMPNVASK